MKEDKNSNVFKGVLYVGIIMNAISFMMFTMTQPATDQRWFTRLSIAYICVGFLYIGEKIDELIASKS